MDPEKKTKTHFDEGFEGFAGFDGQALMSHVAFGSFKKTFWSSLERIFFCQVSRGLRDLKGLRGLKGRPRCLTSLLDPVKKHILKQLQQAPSGKFRGFWGTFGGFEGFEGQAPMFNVAFGSRKKNKNTF